MVLNGYVYFLYIGLCVCDADIISIELLTGHFFLRYEERFYVHIFRVHNIRVFSLRVNTNASL